MKIQIKCSICNSTKLYRIDSFSDDRKRERDIGGRATCRRGVFNYQYSSTVKTGIKMDINTLVDTYICQKCGHVEFYGIRLLEKIEKDKEIFKEKIKTLKTELKVIDERIEQFRKEKNLSYEEFVKTNIGKYDPSIKDYYTEYNDRYKGYRTDIRYLLIKKQDIENAINDYESYLKVVSEIRFK